MAVIDRLCRLISHYEPGGAHDRLGSRGRKILSGLSLGFYTIAFGEIFIPLNTLKAACLNQASRLFFMIVVNRARLALS